MDGVLEEQLALGVAALFARLEVSQPWRRDRREHPEVNFFPGRGESVEPARAICARCLVRRDCAESLSTLPCRVALRRVVRHGRPRATPHGVWRRRYRRPRDLRG